MEDDSDIVKRINNQLATIAENQAQFDERQRQFDEKMAAISEQLDRANQLMDRTIEQSQRNSREIAAMQEAIAGLIQVARIHDEQIDDLTEGLKAQREHLDALMHIVEGHITNHP